MDAESIVSLILYALGAVVCFAIGVTLLEELFMRGRKK